MLTWFSQQVNDHGIILAVRFAGRVVLSRSKTKLVNKLLPVKVTCPCCGWEGRQFYDYHEIGYMIRKVWCPQCDSLPRHRYLSFWLTREFKLENKNGVALVFAPEKAMASFWAAAPDLDVYRIDKETTRGIDIQANIKHLPIESNSVDLIWCHHVLEHVDADAVAIRELHRVLRPCSGELIVSVPMSSAPTTVEYGFADPMDSGHWRAYGEDFQTRLTDGGLTVRAVDFNLPDEDYRRYGFKPERFYIGRKLAPL
ncbi:MAG TPA: class I SAM-dependent methyltransferase [Pyrinomonadaceae bacterium]|nr:class I SAM-dependent methyltransferase [Pyrinomonadaceae bacterium]